MTVGISLLTLVPGVVGGSETYARELCRALAQVGELEYCVFVPTIAADAADGLAARPITRYRASRTLAGRVLAMSAAGLLPGPVRREMRLAELAALHFPLSVMLPPVGEVPAATTILDLQHEFLPGNFSKAELAYRRVVYRRTARRSRIVVTISDHARATLIERMGLEPERVRTIYFGVDHERFRPGDEPREPFLLYPANRWPHKNHERLFEALALLRRDRPELRLVLTGAGHEGRPAPPGVDVRGRVPGDELVRLYRTASALVFPSLYEGFGQPPLEAMASACPVACSNAGSLPEVVGEAARLFDPTEPEDIAAAVEEVLASPEEWTRRGLERARAFTWDECARRHDEVYRELVGG